MSGKTHLVALLATELGKTEQVAKAATAMGADVQVRFDDVGYLRVVVPIERYVELALLSGVEQMRNERDAGDVTCSLVEEEAQPSPRPPLPPEALTDGNPFVPAAADMGVKRLMQEHPTFDGRGVTIGVIEGQRCNGVADVLNPSLRNAISLSGETVPKIAGVISAVAHEPLDSRQSGAYGEGYMDAKNPSRVVSVGTLETDADGKIEQGGKRYIAPAAGKWKLGFYLKEFAVVWDEHNRGVWVDTDRDGDLREEAEMADINVRFSAGKLKIKTDKGNPAERTFVVMFDAKKQSVLLIPGRNDHMTMTAGVAAGHNLGGGASHSPAPAARVILVNDSNSLASYLESYIYAIRDPRVDMITDSSSVEGGGEVIKLILDRLVSIYGKPIVFAASNGGPYLNSNSAIHFMSKTSDGSPKALSIGAYFNRDTYRAFFGPEIPGYHHMWVGSSRGPGSMGALLPSVVAPLYSVGPNACGAWRNDRFYRFPDCYRLSGGTSAATPTAAGAVAVLLSAARQTPNTPTDGITILRAVQDGARFLEGYGAYEQGNGLVDVEKSFELLLARGKADLPEIEVDAPIGNQELRRSGLQRGEGLFEKEGWTAGQRGTREIAFRRRSGASGAITYDLRWRGNDGTFSTKEKIRLPKNSPVSLPIGIAPATRGVHSAVLEVVDPKSGTTVRSVLVTVVAAHRFRKTNNFTVAGEAEVPWPDSHAEYFEVPPGAGTLSINTKILSGSAKLTFAPLSSSYPWYVEEKLLKAGESGVAVIPNPAEGVWELRYEPCIPTRCPEYNEARDAKGPPKLAFNLKVSGADAPNEKIGNVNASLNLKVSNRFAAIGDPQVRAEIASLQEDRRVVKRNEIATPIDIDVEPGATSLRVNATTTGGRNSVTLQLYRCADRGCSLQATRQEAGPGQSLAIDFPVAGRWKAFVIGDLADPKGTEVKVEIVQTAPRYGSATARIQTSGDGAFLASVTPSLSPEVMFGTARPAVVVDLIGRGPQPDNKSLFAIFTTTTATRGLPRSTPRPAAIASFIQPLKATSERSTGTAAQVQER